MEKLMVPRKKESRAGCNESWLAGRGRGECRIRGLTTDGKGEFSGWKTVYFQLK